MAHKNPHTLQLIFKDWLHFGVSRENCCLFYDVRYDGEKNQYYWYTRSMLSHKTRENENKKRKFCEREDMKENFCINHNNTHLFLFFSLTFSTFLLHSIAREFDDWTSFPKFILQYRKYPTVFVCKEKTQEKKVVYRIEKAKKKLNEVNHNFIIIQWW